MLWLRKIIKVTRKILTIFSFIGEQIERNLSVETASVMKIVPLNDIPFKGCQMFGYVFSYHSGSAGLKKCCTTDFCHIISTMSMVSAIVRLK